MALRLARLTVRMLIGRREEFGTEQNRLLDLKQLKLG